jgi:hypothetical protein
MTPNLTKAISMSLVAEDSRVNLIREIIRRDAARQELTDLVNDLDRRGVATFEMFLELGRRNAQLGHPFPSVLEFIRALPGLEKWRPGENWSLRLEGVTGAGIPDPEFEEVRRRSRAYALADWLRYRAGSAIAEEVVAAAGAVALSHAGGEVDCA